MKYLRPSFANWCKLHYDFSSVSIGSGTGQMMYCLEWVLCRSGFEQVRMGSHIHHSSVYKDQLTQHKLGKPGAASTRRDFAFSKTKTRMPRDRSDHTSLLLPVQF